MTDVKHSKRVLAAILLLWVTTPTWADEVLYVQVAETHIRQKPTFLSPALSTLRYGDTVLKLSEKAGASWFEISTDEVTGGWTHKSAFTTSRLVLKAGEQSAQVGAGRSEPTLAGKGFSKETEEEYKKNNDLPFDVLDRVEKLKPDDAEIAQFAREGGLNL